MNIFKKKQKKEIDFIRIKEKQLIDWNEPNGEGCIVSDMITKEGWKVGYMFRDEPTPNHPDSGWRFYKGDENEEYSGNSNNHHVFAINTICNYDSDIIPYLHLPVGTHLIKTQGGGFIEDNGTQAIHMEKQ